MKNLRRTLAIVAIGLLVMVGLALAAEKGKQSGETATQQSGKTSTQTMPVGGAHASIEGRSGTGLSGSGHFMMHGEELMITVEVRGAPAGEHAVHIHEKGECSPPDFTSAGAHFDPQGHQHGAPDAPEHHAGDLGNMKVKEDGTGSLMIHSKDLSVGGGKNGVVGHSIIIHEKADDFVTQPTGNAGGRIGCGVIQVGAEK